MRTKLDRINQASASNSYDVIVATETWLNDFIRDSEIFHSNYSIYRRDRSNTSLAGKEAGGVMIAVHKSYDSISLQNCNSSCEDVWVSLKVNDGNNLRTIIICAVYVQPPVSSTYLSCFLNNFSEVMDNTIADIMLFGDFNLSFIDWSVNRNDTNQGCVPTNYHCNLGYLLVDFMSSNNLIQLNNVRNKNNKILDLIFSNFTGPTVSQSIDILSKVDEYHPRMK